MIFDLSKVFAIPKQTLKLDQQERDYMFRLMVDYDVSVRNLISYVALNYSRYIKNEFDKISKRSSSQNIDIKLQNKMKNKHVWQHVQKIQEIAQNTSEQLDSQVLFNQSLEIDETKWGIIQSSITNITKACRTCHNNIQY